MAGGNGICALKVALQRPQENQEMINLLVFSGAETLNFQHSKHVQIAIDRKQEIEVSEFFSIFNFRFLGARFLT
jgi:hypothetical protein